MKRNWNAGLLAGGMHLAVSLIIAGIVATLVFGLWYPYPYREISGGRELFKILILVDVVIGPLITLMVFNPIKPRRELSVDLTLIAALQIIALGYGVWTLYAARPVHLVFEYSRMAVVHAADIDPLTLVQAPLSLQKLPLAGPTLLSLRPFKDGNEELLSTMAALGGVSQASQPALWQSWDAARAQLLQESRSIDDLKRRFQTQVSLIENATAATNKPVSDLRYVPLLTRKGGWTVLLDVRNNVPVGFLPIDSF